MGEIKVVIPEVLLLKGVWASNRTLWWWSFPMHLGLYLTVAFSGLAELIVNAMAEINEPFIEWEFR